MDVKNIIITIATLSLTLVVGCMCWMFIYAIIDPSVDDKEVFTIIGPAFQTIVGGFIGLITGIQIGKKSGEEE